MKSKSKSRNRHACAEIMKKGGVHEKTNKVKRHQLKKSLMKELQKEAANWQPYLILTSSFNVSYMY